MWLSRNNDRRAYFYIYLVSCCYPSEVWDIGNGPHWESLVNKAIMDKHIGYAKHSNSKTLMDPVNKNEGWIRELDYDILVNSHMPGSLINFSSVNNKKK